jgi:hypothetical protein
MKETKVETSSCDVMLDEIIVNKSERLTPRPAVAPVLSEEEQTFADAVKRYQIEHRRTLLNWRDMFEIVQALGYRRVEQTSTPPPLNGNPQDPARPDGAGNETPS